MLVSNCAICVKKKSTFIKNQELHNFNNIKIISLKGIKSLTNFC